MRSLAEAILAQLATVPGIKFQRMWNDQLNQDENGSQYSFPAPAVFPELLSPNPAKQLGDGVQLFDPLIVRLHILHVQLDAGDGTMEQNLDAWTFAQEVYKKFQKFDPDGAVAFTRTSEERDYNHKAIYHLIQDYTTNYIDSTVQESTDGTIIPGNTLEPIVNGEYDPSPFLKEL